ncbi:MAG TPA: ribbon-helix-helix protein, CopG family [Anaerolineae bacterium]|nr:ribbon-helix-helix protein, CopG family [Anaerolineae bacterium]
MMIKVMVTMPPDLLKAVDEAARKLKLNRSQFVRQALREMLERLQQEEFEALLAEGYKEMAGENTAIAEESSDAQTVATKEVWR